MTNGPFFITRYALGSGIITVGSAKATDSTNGKDRFINHHGTILYFGRDVFDNEADAKADAEARRKKKIASMQKQIAKLQAVKF